MSKNRPVSDGNSVKLALATEAWLPQVNGVACTMTETVGRLKSRGFDVDVFAPDCDTSAVLLRPGCGHRRTDVDF